MFLLKILLVLFLSDVAYISCTKYTIRPKNDKVKLTKYHKKVNEGDKDSAEDHHPEESSTFGDQEGFGSFAEDASSAGPDNYFMDQYFSQEKPHLLEFGHACEDPNVWEQRYEKKDLKANRHQGQHKPEKDHYGFGYRRGNDHHFQERYEKAHPQFGEFQTKVKWGDIHGGHGEHHWDYNHDGGHDDGDDDDGTGTHNDGELDEISDITPLNEEVEETKQENERAAVSKPTKPEIGLVFNVETGMVIDKITGQKYKLHPVP